MERENIIHIQRFLSPCGELLLGAFEDKLCLCDWKDSRHIEAGLKKIQRGLNAVFEESPSDVILEATSQLNLYFQGKGTTFSIPLLFVGSDFQQQVWRKLLDIPYGETISYGELACSLGRPKAVRAVANAVGTNVISIFAPCHRVIGSNHSLTGYRGSLTAKKFLLELEKPKNKR